MSLSFGAGNLLSRAVAKGKSLATSPMASNLINGAVRSQVSIANYLKGFAISAGLSAIPHLIWSVTAIWDLFVQGVLFVYYFDWNIPDTAIDSRAESQWRNFAGLLGGTVGNTLGWLACGVLPATQIMAINESMGAYVLKEVGEEAFEEFIFNAGFVIRQTLITLAQQGFYNTYKNLRKWLKDPENPLLDRLLPGRAAEIRANWGEADGQSFTFAGAVEERIEQIPSEFWRNFTEEMVQEAFDACIEAGYVVANSIDGWLAQERLGRRMNEERLRVVEVQPDRSNEREKIIIAGPEADAKAAITEAIAHYQLIDNRDVGQIVGTSVDDYVRNTPLSLRIKFQLFNVPSPPYGRPGPNNVRRVAITIPDVKRSALDWDRLRFAVGGSNGYLWGPYRAVGRIEGGQYVRVWGASEAEAEDRLKALMALSESELQTINVVKQIRDLERIVNDRLYHRPERIYPGYITVINRQRVLAADRGRIAVDGNYLDRSERFDLWRQTKPIDFEEKIVEILRFSSFSDTPSP